MYAPCTDERSLYIRTPSCIGTCRRSFAADGPAAIFTRVHETGLKRAQRDAWKTANTARHGVVTAGDHCLLAVVPMGVAVVLLSIKAEKEAVC